MPENGTYGSIGGRWGCRNLWRDGTRTRWGNPAGLSPSRPTGDAEPAAYLTDQPLLLSRESAVAADGLVGCRSTGVGA